MKLIIVSGLGTDNDYFNGFIDLLKDSIIHVFILTSANSKDLQARILTEEYDLVLAFSISCFLVMSLEKPSATKNIVLIDPPNFKGIVKLVATLPVWGSLRLNYHLLRFLNKSTPEIVDRVISMIEISEIKKMVNLYIKDIRPHHYKDTQKTLIIRPSNSQYHNESYLNHIETHFIPDADHHVLYKDPAKVIAILNKLHVYT